MLVTDDAELTVVRALPELLNEVSKGLLKLLDLLFKGDCDLAKYWPWPWFWFFLAELKLILLLLLLTLLLLLVLKLLLLLLLLLFVLFMLLMLLIPAVDFLNEP